MKKLVSSTTTFGPFENITVVSAGYDCDGVMFDYTVVGECQIEDWTGPIPVPTPDYSTQNKQQAQQLLSATDWTSIPDVANPQLSSPYLMNQAEFIAWRSQVRAIAVNPPTTPADFPPQPTEQWSN